MIPLKNLRLLRESYKISQQKLADHFDLAQSQIQSYEAGSYEPDIETMKKFADFFETSVDYLIGYTNVRHKIEPREEYSLNQEEKLFVDKFRYLLPNQRKSLSMFMDTLVGN